MVNNFNKFKCWIMALLFVYRMFPYAINEGVIKLNNITDFVNTTEPSLLLKMYKKALFDDDFTITDNPFSAYKKPKEHKSSKKSNNFNHHQALEFIRFAADGCNSKEELTDKLDKNGEFQFFYHTIRSSLELLSSIGLQKVIRVIDEVSMENVLFPQKNRVKEDDVCILASLYVLYHIYTYINKSKELSDSQKLKLLIKISSQSAFNNNQIIQKKYVQAKKEARAALTNKTSLIREHTIKLYKEKLQSPPPCWKKLNGSLNANAIARNLSQDAMAFARTEGSGVLWSGDNYEQANKQIAKWIRDYNKKNLDA